MYNFKLAMIAMKISQKRMSRAGEKVQAFSLAFPQSILLPSTPLSSCNYCAENSMQMQVQ